MVRTLPVIVLLTLLGSGIFGARHFGNAPVDAGNTAPVEVTIPQGSGGKEIARLLHDAGLLRSTTGFLARLGLSGARGDLKAGTYAFARAESGRKILERLQNGDALPTDVSVTVPEGFTLEDIASRLESAGVVRAREFQAAARVEKFRGEFPFLASAPDGSLEGYLFPDTYRFFRGTSSDDVLRKFLERFDKQFQKIALETGGLDGPAHSASLHEVVTTASIVEREVPSLDDRRLVAGILWSRRAHGVALAADATVRYAIRTWDRPLTVDDLAVDSPYNTRRYAGLPPGPIGNPGAESLRAALDPRDSDFFYYLSTRDRKTIFSKTLEEHNRAIQEHLR